MSELRKKVIECYKDIFNKEPKEYFVDIIEDSLWDTEKYLPGEGIPRSIIKQQIKESAHHLLSEEG